jgi:hypothetical protein
LEEIEGKMKKKEEECTPGGKYGNAQPIFVQGERPSGLVT